MHTLDVVFKQSSPPPLPQAQKHTQKNKQIHCNTSRSYLACQAKYRLMCLKESHVRVFIGHLNYGLIGR